MEKSTDSYVQRIGSLARNFESLNCSGRALCLTYEDLTVTPTVTFQRLQSFLGLATGFSEQYAMHKFTGIRGDRSANIKAGRILRERPAEPVEIPPDLLERAEQAYAACLHTMKLQDGRALAGLSNVRSES